MAFPILPGMDFEWLDPEGTPNRRWRAVMPHDVWQKVVNLRLYGSEVAPPGVPQFWLKKPRKQMDRSKKAERKPRTKKRPMRRSRKAKFKPPVAAANSISPPQP